LNFTPLTDSIILPKKPWNWYAPLANRLGIYRMQIELEDIAFRYLDYESYAKLAGRIALKREKRDQYTEEVKSIIQGKLDEYGLKGVVEGRAKHFWSIHKKMHEQKIDLTRFMT